MTSAPGPAGAPPEECAELLVHEVERAGPGAVEAVVRCLRWTASGARFTRVRGREAAVDLRVARILVYGREAPSLDPVCSGKVLLRGTGGTSLAPGDAITGSNRPPGHGSMGHREAG
ncbi:hypothetical protein J0910_14885 [Nocardiopsis sp. CNT-189]|uniref:hypothetical protein n=1 Tax=Nocardiopsis oceanisediminis TaxID=2816862 RepID=UPI003B36B840